MGSAPSFDFTPVAFSVTAVCLAWTLLWRDGSYRGRAGIETEDQARFLCEHSCDELQGFLFGGSLPPDEFARFLEQEKLEE